MIVLARYVALRQSFQLSAMRLNADGSIDPTFGDGGFVLVPFDINVDTRDMKVDPQGRLVLVGEGDFDTGQERFVMTRLTADGSVDPSFGRVDVGNQQFLSFWRGFDLALLRTVIVPWLGAGVGDASAYFFVEGQIKRHGCVFIVSLNCLMFSPAGSRSIVATFSFSDEFRRFRRVISILLFSVRLVLIFSMLVSE